MKKVVIWGAGGTGKSIIEDVKKKYNVVSFVDTDSRKWGKLDIEGYPVKDPEEVIRGKNFEYVIIASQPGFDRICKKLKEWGIEDERIVSSYVELPLMARNRFLTNISKILTQENIEGVCAEAGVFNGDFAKHINSCFPNRKIYLFDTFEGFSERDIDKERELGASQAISGDYSYTTIETVMEKMEYPDNVIIKKGYFPDTAMDIDDKFCFINLDLDLYLPTINGLNWVKSKMAEGGIVLVHDYFSDTFLGPKKAVDLFLKENPLIKKVPIGDGISIALLGF